MKEIALLLLILLICFSVTSAQYTTDWIRPADNYLKSGNMIARDVADNVIWQHRILFPAVMQIFSMTGQKVMQMELNYCSNTINTEGLINGFYIISVQYNGKVKQVKLQINK